LWNAAEGRSYSMPVEGAGPRLPLLPEPDLLPLIVSAEFLEETRARLPELPEARRARMIADYELATKDAFTLTATREFADRFEAAAKTARNPRRSGQRAAERDRRPAECAGHGTGAVAGFNGRHCAGRRPAGRRQDQLQQLKQLFDMCFEKNEDFPAVYEREKPQQITDASLSKPDRPGHCRQPQTGGAVSRRQEDRGRLLCGQVMRASKGQANPALLNELVTKKLEG